MINKTFVLSVFVVNCCLVPAQASQIKDKMDDLAGRILATTKGQPVSVGVFSHTGLPQTNGGPGIEGLLEEALEKREPGIVRPGANYEVKGDYLLVKSRAHPELARVVKVTARIINLDFGQVLANVPFQLEIEVDHTKDIASVLQETVALPPQGTKKERNKLLVQAVTDPSAFIHGTDQTRISSNRSSQYAVEILTKPLGGRSEPTAQRAVMEGGRAFVDIKRGELYEVRVHNASGQEVAVRLSVDGLDMFHFSQDRDRNGSPAFTHLIVPANSVETIVGWHNSISGRLNYRSFLVTAYGQGAASKEGIKARGKVGVILVQFAHCRALVPGARAAPGNETGFGPPRTVRQEKVRREVEPPHDFVSVRYSR